MKRAPANLALFLALSLPAQGDEEKIFHLKNGRKIQGELIEETKTTYVIRSATGKLFVAKDQVKSVEAPPVPSKPFLEPDKRRPSEGDDAAVSTPSQTTPSSGSSTPSTSRGSTPLPTSSYTGPLASGSEIESARKALLAVPQVTIEDQAGTTAAREKACDEIMKTCSLGEIGRAHV